MTDNQIIYRRYLGSRVWKAKRIQALDHYGCKCSRCGQFGSDVHHKTYERVGGNETLEDLEIMCRECHEAHHRLARATRMRIHDSSGKRPRGIKMKALVGYLTPVHRAMLEREFDLPWKRISTLIQFNFKKPTWNLRRRAKQLLGK